MLYQALPEQTTLFECLRSDRNISTLFTRLFHYGRGIFHILQLDQDELNEILDWIASEQPFSSRLVVQQVMNELCASLERTKALHLGVAEQTAHLEKSQNRIQEGLSQELKRIELDTASVLMEKLLYGNEVLAPEFFESHDDQLYLVPPKVVKEGAKVLREIDPKNLFGGEGKCERDDRKDFEQWKAFYLEAAERDEAVLVHPA